jgi:HK97 family phage portal protein
MWSDGERWGQDGNSSSAISFDSIIRTQPVVAAAVNKLTRQASTLPLRTYRSLDDNKRERLTDHPVHSLLHKPIPRRGAVHLKQWAFRPMLAHGNSLIAKYREDPDGPPTALLPVDWRHIEAYAASGGCVEWWATTQTGERRWIRVEDTIHFAWMGESEVGISPLEHLGTTVKIEDAAQRYQASTMENGVRPSAGVTMPEGHRASDPEVRQFFREQIEGLHKGVDRAGKFFLLPPGGDIKPLTFSAADAQLIQQRKINREEIAMVYDLPGPLIGDLEHGTYSNVTELNKQLYKSVLRPWLTLVEETIQAQFIDPEPGWEDIFVEFDLSDQLRGDPAEMASAIKSNIESGVMTRNEGREAQNLPPADDEGADKLTYPANNQAPLSNLPGPAVPSTDPPPE